MNTSPKSTQSEFAVQETNDSILQRLTTRVRGNSASSYSEMVVVKLADTIGKYKRNRSNVPGVLGDVLVNMGGMPAAVGGFRPKDRISEDDRYGAGLFLRQMSAYIGRESGRSSLSFYEHGNVRGLHFTHVLIHFDASASRQPILRYQVQQSGRTLLDLTLKSIVTGRPNMKMPHRSCWWTSKQTGLHTRGAILIPYRLRRTMTRMSCFRTS